MELIREALENIKEGINVGGMLISAFRFAVDQVMTAYSQEELQGVMDCLNLISIECGVKLNITKTKVMKITSKE